MRLKTLTSVHRKPKLWMMVNATTPGSPTEINFPRRLRALHVDTGSVESICFVVFHCPFNDKRQTTMIDARLVLVLLGIVLLTLVSK